jgi:phage baseplate assembly protein W
VIRDNHDGGARFGRGISFPPRLGPDGRVAWSAGPENIREAIRVILLTELEERVMLPQLGGGLRRYLFQPNTVSTHRLIQRTITQALGRWEPRIDVESVEVEPDAEDPQAALATLRYRLVATQAADQLTLRVRFTT